MIDFVKFRIEGIDIYKFKNREDLDFASRVKLTGEINDDQLLSTKEGMKFEIRKNKCLLSYGSLHKYLKGNNYGDFSPIEIKKAVELFESQYDIDSNLCYLQNVEIGLNIDLPISPKSVLQENVLNYGGKSKNSVSEYKGRGYCIQFGRSQYIIKLYDKGLQHNLENNLLRIEVRVKKMQQIQHIVKTLADLKDESLLFSLFEYLKKKLNDIVIVDSINPNALNLDESERELFIYGCNDKFWETIKPNSSEFEKGSNDPDYTYKRQLYYKLRKSFFEILEKYDLQKTKQLIQLGIKNKIHEYFGYCTNEERLKVLSDNKINKVLINNPEYQEYRIRKQFYH